MWVRQGRGSLPTVGSPCATRRVAYHCFAHVSSSRSWLFAIGAPGCVPIMSVAQSRSEASLRLLNNFAVCAEVRYCLDAAMPTGGVSPALPHALPVQALMCLPSPGSLAVRSCSEVLVALCQVPQRIAVRVADDR